MATTRTTTTTTTPVADTEPSRVELVLRQVDYWRTVYRRTWKGSVITSFVQPLFYVAAMGLLLGGYVDDGTASLEGAPSYLAFIAPGLLAAQGMQIAAGETMWPVMGMIKWQRTYYGMIASPLRVSDVVAAHMLFVLFRISVSCGVFALVLAPFDVYASIGGALLAFLAAVLVGMAFAAPVYAFAAGAQDRAVVRRHLPPRHHAAVPLLRRVLPDLQPHLLDGGAGPDHPAVARRRPRPHGDAGQPRR